MATESLDRFRAALKFSLWAWALYWPGGGLLLLGGGLDPVSIAVTVACVGMFVVLLRSGALRTTSGMTVRAVLLERPIYLLTALVTLVVLAPFVDPVENMGLGVFATLFFASVVFALVQLRAHVRALGTTWMEARADQALLYLLIAAGGSFVVAYDGLGQALGGGTVGFGAHMVAAMTWLNLLFPPLLLLATRGLREELRWGRAAPRPEAPGPAVAPHAPLAAPLAPPAPRRG